MHPYDERLYPYDDHTHDHPAVGDRRATDDLLLGSVRRRLVRVRERALEAQAATAA